MSVLSVFSSIEQHMIANSFYIRARSTLPVRWCCHELRAAGRIHTKTVEVELNRYKHPPFRLVCVNIFIDDYENTDEAD